MPVRQLDDGSGETLRVLDIGDYFLPTADLIFDDQEASFNSLVDWEAKANDILLCAYPKAGTHWLWEMTSMLVNRSSDRVKLVKETSMLECVTKQMYDNIAEPRVINTHIPFQYLPRNTLKQKCKILFVQRNPKDVCVSFFNHHSKILEYEYDGKWDNYMHRFLNGLVDYGSWFDYTLGWERVIKDNPEHPIHVLSYEGLKQDCVSELKKIRDFLGVKADDELLKEIADRCEFSKMKKEKDPLEKTSEWKDGRPGMYRKGQVGDWKNWFTVAQNEHFDQVYAGKMKDSSFNFTFH